MSCTPFFFVEKYNYHTKQYELQHPIVWNFEHTGQETADLYPYNGDHELFDLLEGRNYENHVNGIHVGLPQDCCKEIKDKFNECSYTTEWNGESNFISPDARWFTYADMYIYCLENPEVTDWEAIEADSIRFDNDTVIPKKPTPMKSLKHRIDAFLEVMDGWDWRDYYSQIRIVFWVE